MRAVLTGLSIASGEGAITTYEQFGGTGCVRNKALAIPGHLNGQQAGPWASVEYVRIDPITEGIVSSVGEHTQTTDEIYCILEGEGIVTTNGVPAAVSAGWVVIAPRGTTHTIRNESPTTTLSFLVVELDAPGGASVPPALINLASQMDAGDIGAPVFVAGKVIHPRRALLNLHEYLGGPWGSLCWAELPPSAIVETYSEKQADQLFLLKGCASVGIFPYPPTTRGESREEIVVESMGTDYQCVIVPPGIPRRVVNRASGPYPVFLLCLTIGRSALTKKRRREQ